MYRMPLIGNSNVADQCLALPSHMPTLFRIPFDFKSASETGTVPSARDAFTLPRERWQQHMFSPHELCQTLVASESATMISKNLEQMSLKGYHAQGTRSCGLLL